jgi:KilA-N domain
MAKASNKRFHDWNRSESVKSYIDVLSSVTGIPVTELVEVNQGGIPEKQGTWGHPKVALRFAQWCSDEFAVQVDFWIDELVTTGKVELDPALPVSLDEKLEVFFKAQKILDNVSDGTLRYIALSALDKEAQNKYGVSIQPECFRVPESRTKSEQKAKKSTIAIDSEDIFYVKNIAKVINKVTSGKTETEFCMSVLNARNAALKAGCIKDKVKINKIMCNLVEIGILEISSKTRKDSYRFNLKKRYSADEIVSKYKKYMTGVVK